MPSTAGSAGFPSRPLAANENVDLGTIEIKSGNSETRANVGTGVAANALRATLATDVGLPAGTSLLGRAVADASAATGGIVSTARLASAAASTNATNVTTTASRIYSMQGKNAAGYDVFLVLYDSALNPPVPGTTTIRKKIPLPAGAAFVLDWPVGLSFASGIGYAFTKLVADADTTALAAADVVGFNIDYA